jgi:hypothetical protein
VTTPVAAGRRQQTRVDTAVDARGMMTDGESLKVTAGPWAIWALPDMGKQTRDIVAWEEPS